MAWVVVKQQQFADGSTILLVEGVSKLVKLQYIVQVYLQVGPSIRIGYGKIIALLLKTSGGD